MSQNLYQFLAIVGYHLSLEQFLEKMLNTTLDTGTVRATLKTTPLMEAVRFHGPRDIRVETIDEPICGKGEVKVLCAIPTA